MRKRCWVVCVLLVLLGGCGAHRTLVDMQSTVVGDLRAVVWEERVYVPFCVVPLSEKGEQVGFVDGDPEDRISAYGDAPVEEWLVSWLAHDGGALLLKEQNVVDIPEGLVQEYGPVG